MQKVNVLNRVSFDEAYAAKGAESKGNATRLVLVGPGRRGYPCFPGAYSVLFILFPYEMQYASYYQRAS